MHTLCLLLHGSYFYAVEEERSNMIWVEKLICQLNFQSFVMLMVQFKGNLGE
jgi:hypothetical protein